MQIPNQRVFSLNSAVTPEIQWGTVSPSTNSGNVTLTAMPVGSMYVQQIGGSPITSCIVWVKTVSDIVAAQNLVNPWTAVSQASVADGAAYPDFASDEFMAYQPGMIYIHNETKDTGTYRTAWLKVSDGGTRSDWVSLAESESLERVIASITATGLTTDIAEAATLTWRYLTTGTPTTLEEEPSTAGIVRTDLRLNIPSDGLYEVRAGCVMTNSGAVNCVLSLAVDGVAGEIMDSAYDGSASYGIRMQGSRLVRLEKDNVVGLAVAALAASGTYTLTDMNLSIILVAP
jgi:hypothetical protein